MNIELPEEGQRTVGIRQPDCRDANRKEAYFANACARTSLLKDAKQDLAALSKLVNQAIPKKRPEKETPSALSDNPTFRPLALRLALDA